MSFSPNWLHESYKQLEDQRHPRSEGDALRDGWMFLACCIGGGLVGAAIPIIAWAVSP